MIIPAFNRADVLARAVESVLSHDGADIELIVVDDGSTDDTPALLAAYDDSRLRTVRQENAGVCAARNAGVDASSAAFLVFLDSDDEAASGWVEFFRTAAVEGADFAACGVRIVAQGGDESFLVPLEHGVQFGYIEARFLSGAFGLSTSLFLDVGGFRAGLRYSEHTDLALRLGGRMLDEPFVCRRTDAPLVVMYRGDRSYNAEVRYESAMVILREDAVHLERSRRLHSTYASIAGVAASKLGRSGEAKRLLSQAIRLHPLEWRNYVRLARELFPGRRGDEVLRDTAPDT